MQKSFFLKQFNVTEESLNQICGDFGVRSLYIFGSAISPSFRAGESDLDFLVEFYDPSFDVFFDFLDALRTLFRYSNIDLVTIGSLKNQVIRDEILASRKVLYAA